MLINFNDLKLIEWLVYKSVDFGVRWGDVKGE